MKISVYHRNSLTFLRRDFPIRFYTGGKICKLSSSIKKTPCLFLYILLRRSLPTILLKNIYSQKRMATF